MKRLRKKKGILGELKRKDLELTELAIEEYLQDKAMRDVALYLARKRKIRYIE